MAASRAWRKVVTMVMVETGSMAVTWAGWATCHVDVMMVAIRADWVAAKRALMLADSLDG